MMDCVGCGLWHCTMEDKRGMDENLLRVERERAEARRQVAALREALLLTRAECDLPDHVAEAIGDALAATKDGVK